MKKRAGTEKTSEEDNQEERRRGGVGVERRCFFVDAVSSRVNRLK
jgi:hypothetical protein